MTHIFRMELLHGLNIRVKVDNEEYKEEDKPDINNTIPIILGSDDNQIEAVAVCDSEATSTVIRRQIMEKMSLEEGKVKRKVKL